MRRLPFIILFLTSTLANSQSFSHDESYQDKSFIQFKLKLIQATISKDIKLLKTLVASNKDFYYSACDQFSADCFISDYEDELQSDWAWKELYQTISYGFAKIRTPDEQQFSAPAFMQRFNGEFNEILIKGSKVNIREEPSLNAKVVRQASYEKFSFNPEFMNSNKAFVNSKLGYWYEINLKKGKKGYVVSKYVTQGYESQLFVKKVDGIWKIVGFQFPQGC